MEGKQRPLAQAGEEDDTRRGPPGASAWPRTYPGTEGDSPEDRPQEGGQDRTQWARVGAARLIQLEIWKEGVGEITLSGPKPPSCHLGQALGTMCPHPGSFSAVRNC